MGPIRRLEPFANVGANQRAILQSSLVLGNTLEQIVLTLGGTTFTKSHLGVMRAKVNQKTIWELSTGNDLNAIQLYNGHPAAAAYLSLMFSEPRARDRVGQMMGALDLSAGASTFTLEVDIGAATSPTLTAHAILSPPQSKEGGAGNAVSPLMRALLLTTIPISAAVTDAAYEVNIPRGSLLKRLYIMHANLTGFRVKRDGVDIWESVTPALANFVEDEYGHDPQSGMYVYDPILDDNMSAAIPTVRPDGRLATHQFLFTTSGSDTLRVYADVYTPLSLI